jgi:hypothetical protein
MDERFDLNGIGFVWNTDKASASLEAVIGMAEDGRLLFVVHIAFEQELVRIISARKATRSERRRYEE